MKTFHKNVATVLCAALISLMFAGAANADQPIVSAVPGDANNPTIRHPIIAGRPVTLKGAVDAASIGANWSWDPGDGSAPYTGAVAAATHFAVWAEHTYTGSAGDFFTATLTVDNTVDAVGTATFSVTLRANTVPNRANAAIAEGLWYMHRVQRRFDGDETAVEGQAGSIIPMGSWNYPATSGQLSVSVQGATLNAFEANGHRENGDASNPYTETVSRGMKYLFARLAAVSLDVQTVGPLDPANPRSDDPDGDGNGLGVTLDGRNLGGIIGSQQPYQLGMVMDAIVASGRPGAMTTTGPTDVIGRTYAGITQDMVDWYAMAQSDSAIHGGWRYSPYNNNGGAHDNSTSGWAATGITAAEDLFNSIVPGWLKTRNLIGLELTDNESDTNDNDGAHGYTNSPSPGWGYHGVTGAAMVQMSMNGMEATTSPTPDERWARTENHFRRHFDDAASGNNFKNYYYAIFNFTKAMRTAKPAPVTIIGTQPGAADGGVGCGPSAGCAANGPQPLDWYNDPVSGLAQTIVNYQTTTGANIGLFSDRAGNSQGSSQDDHNQPWATQILTRTLAQAGPIGVGAASPNPAGENFPITFDHSRSFHQDPNRTLTTFEWDLDGNGVYTDAVDESRTELVQVVGSGTNEPVIATYNCGAGGLPCSHTMNLRVTDDATPPVTTTDVVILDLTIPPHAPTADAGGPYAVCAGGQLALDGGASFDIDAGNSESGAEPFDGITLYEWELDGVSPFDYAESDSPDDPTTTWTFDTVGVAGIGLRVTDNSSLSYPSASETDLTDTDNTFVTVANCISTDLAVTATASAPTFVVPVEGVTVTGTVVNNGGEDVTDVVVVANLADLVTIISIDPAKGSCVATGIKVGTQDQYKCDIGDLAVNESVDILIEFDAPDEGLGLFEFTVDLEGGPLVQLTDSNPSNNSFAVTINFIDEVIIVIKGKGSGAFGLFELMLLSGLVVAIVAARRRKAVRSTAAAIALALILVVATIDNPAQADENDKGWYMGGAIGVASSDINSAQFAADLAAAGYNVSDVELADNETGFKLTAGYMFNENVSTQISFVDLGELESEFTAAVPPDEIDALLDTAAALLPGRGEGLLADLVLQFPVTERISVYGTLGIFLAGPRTEQKVTVGGTGISIRSDSDNNFAGSIGVSIAATDTLSVKVGWEHYDIDGNTTNFPMAALSYRFGAK